ncbi:lipoyl(octanoyl) transferase LipB [Chloroflexota bacterium]
MPCTVYQLGLIDYSEAYRLQRELLNKRLNNEIEDVLLLLEHPPVLTIGKSGSLDNVLISREQLAQKGISLFFIDRGGDVTYHGPGQIVGYPIINLKHIGRNLHQFVYDLEEVLLRTLYDFSIEAHRDSSHRGVWTEGAEIAAIGLRVMKWVSMHGFALNVNTDLEPFRLINPCGLVKGKATSMAQILGRNVPPEAVTASMIRHFSEVFCP